MKAFLAKAAVIAREAIPSLCTYAALLSVCTDNARTSFLISGGSIIKKTKIQGYRFCPNIKAIFLLELSLGIPQRHPFRSVFEQLGYNRFLEEWKHPLGCHENRDDDEVGEVDLHLSQRGVSSFWEGGIRNTETFLFVTLTTNKSEFGT